MKKKGGKTAASVQDSVRVMKRLGLLDINNFNRKKADGLLALSRAQDYERLWTLIMKNKMYDLLLTDQSLLLYNVDTSTKTSYCYYQAPLSVQSYEDFAFEKYGDDWKHVPANARDEYELAMESITIQVPATPMRYDYDPKSRSPGRHPAAHLHIGIDSHIRLAVKYVLTPYAFTLLVLRQCYPDHWAALLNLEKDGELRLRQKVREPLLPYPAGLWTSGDERELYLQ